MTPDTVETRIGTLKFVDGVPTDETTQNGLRPSRLPARRRGLPQLHPGRVDRSDAPGQRRDGRDQEQPGRHLRSAARFQSAVPHRQHRHRLLHASFSIWRRTGRPSSRFRPAAGPARSTTRSSASSSTWAAPAPTAGKGGKYLIVPADYKGDAAEGRKDGGEYFVARSPSYVNWLILRGFLVDGKPDAAVEDVPRGRQDLSAQQGGQPADDGVHQRLEGAVQHGPRQQLRVLPGARSRHPEGAARLHRSRAARPRRRASASARASRSRPTSG